MADEYRNWCNPSTSTSSPPSSSALTGMETFPWPMEIDIDTKTSSSLHTQRHGADTDALVPIQSLEMMGLPHSYLWNQPFLRGGGEKQEIQQSFTKIQHQGVWKDKLYYGESEDSTSSQIIKSSNKLQYHGCSETDANCGSHEENMMLPFFINDDNYSANCNINPNNMDGGVISYTDVLGSPSCSSSRQLIFSNVSPPWNSAAESTHPGLIPVTLPQGIVDVKYKGARNEQGETYKKHGKETGAGKRQRSEVGGSGGLPAFKVRKEKMGDRITTLQQLVSPFGKTDTASVLSEAIEYIKFLHQQVFVLCAPYINNGSKHIKARVKGEGEESTTKDLRSKGLCMVPTSSTSPMVNETGVEFWAPTYGGTFK